MANTTIPNLPAAVGLNGTEQIPAVQAGTSVRVTSQQIADLAVRTTSVSSVAQTFTGGLISVSGSPITTSGTLALTVAGTSGGIPYFNSGTSWATSAALAANALVIGGGAGAAPSTTTTGTGVIAALGSAVSGSGGIALTTNPIFTTPTLGVATATSVNGLTINTTTGTLALANGSTLATSGAFNTTLTATAATNVTLPTTGTLATTANTVASFSAGSTGLTPSTATTGAITLGGTLGPTYGGTGLSATPTNGQLLIGNGTGYSLNTLTAGTGVSITNAAGTITIANNSAASVSSVAQTFTGGLISVSGSPITTSGTLALTVAGTSGGIPYFNSGTSWATSAALTANALVIGGGVGAAPSTTTTGTGVLTALGNAVNTAGGLATSAVTSLGSLSTVGTITSGTWNGSVVSPTYGGTGVNNGTNTLTLGGSLTTSGAYPVTITATGTTSVTLPTTGNMLSSVTAVAAITGTPSSSTFIRGDGTWATPSGGGNVLSSGTPSNGQIAQWTGVSTIQGLATTGSGNAVLANGPALSAPTFSTSATVTAGTNAQGQGALTSDYNVITTTAANPSGVTLPTATTGRIVWVFNRGTNPVNVYPASGAAIDALGTNAAITLPVNAWLEFNAASTTRWYSSTLHQPTIYGTITFAAGP